MTADPLPRATRVRKARRSSKVGCGHYVLVGQVIVRRAGKWACLPCALATRPGMVRLPPAGPRHTEGMTGQSPTGAD